MNSNDVLSESLKTLAVVSSKIRLTIETMDKGAALTLLSEAHLMFIKASNEIAIGATLMVVESKKEDPG